jgi:hypothetical protein
LSYLAEIKAKPAAVGIELRDDAYVLSNDPAHTRPWNPHWVTNRVADVATAAGVELDIKGGRHYAGTTGDSDPAYSASRVAALPNSGKRRDKPVWRRR